MKNVEIKAKCFNPNKVREILRKAGADFIGIDSQRDTYFNVKNGRLKLRQGEIENHLIYYERENTDAPKRSDVILYKSSDPEILKQILDKSIGIKVEVFKRREIYFIDNVKFHIDTVEGLGSFIEIEAQDYDNSKTEEFLYSQCEYYLQLFGIPAQNLISVSYSDMLLEQTDRTNSRLSNL